MRAASSEMPFVSTLDAFYEELAEKAENEGLCLPWYKTCLIVQTQQQLRRFRSEINLPGLRLESSDGEKFFIPEAKFTGIAENRKGAENAAACEACGFLKTFTQRSELVAAEWTIDSENALYRSIQEAQPTPSSSPRHHLLVIAPVVPLNYRNRKELRPKPRESQRPSPPPPPSRPPSSPRSSTSDGEHLALLSNEVSLLKIQIDRLNSLVEQHNTHPPSSSLTLPPSTSYLSELRPA